MRIESEVVLPRRVVPQPRPGIVAGGDCGACVLAGLLGISVPEVYDRLLGKRAPLNYFEQRQALIAAEREGLIDRQVSNVPIFVIDDGHGEVAPQMTWGMPSWAQNLAWWNHLRMALDGGYYGVAEVVYSRKGPWEMPDHVVLFCGVREIHPPAGETGAIKPQVLVSCSASCPEGEWVDLLNLLRHRGGFTAQFARPVAAL